MPNSDFIIAASALIALLLGIWAAMQGARDHHASLRDAAHFTTYTLALCLAIAYCPLGLGFSFAIATWAPSGYLGPLIGSLLGFGVTNALIAKGWLEFLCPQLGEIQARALRKTGRRRRERIVAFKEALAKLPLAQLRARGLMYAEGPAFAQKIRRRSRAEQAWAWAGFLAKKEVRHFHGAVRSESRMTKQVLYPLAVGIVLLILEHGLDLYKLLLPVVHAGK